MMSRTTSSVLCLVAAILVAPSSVPAEQKTHADPTQQVPDPDARPPANNKPLKVFILMGQSNMIGFGRVDPDTTQGTLAYLVRKENRYPHLLDDAGNWTTRNDVWCVQVTVGKRKGWLTPGFGARDTFIGPELQFGHVMGHIHDEMVLLIKASQGNRSLGWDILPPGSERFTFDGKTYAGYKDTPSSWVEGEPKKAVNWYAGKQYDDFVNDIQKVLDDLPASVPSYKGQGYHYNHNAEIYMEIGNALGWAMADLLVEE